ncbi:tRNA:m(4)X modification enzyme TRM13 [Smittium mucronatum]|uniref:tRNA:m(4)X modification enzyme TRM13 n=1 Tax=Smittium mucronatum TaxID=133383 RepID=A0A1R0H2N2_9FUNG|nr:tRNA:m(4)X modification enzyme TRM13 [Smittium mucronatum]
MGAETIPVNPVKNGCQFYVKHKSRFCKLMPKKFSAYCGEHAFFESSGTSQQVSAVPTRVPCPYDTSQALYFEFNPVYNCTFKISTVDVKKLESHMKNKCNSRPKSKDSEFLKRDFNISVNQPNLSTLPKIHSFNFIDFSSDISQADQLDSLITSEGWSSGTANLSVLPGELKYTKKYSSLFGDLNPFTDISKVASKNIEVSEETTSSSSRAESGQSLLKKQKLSDSIIEKELNETITKNKYIPIDTIIPPVIFAVNTQLGIEKDGEYAFIRPNNGINSYLNNLKLPNVDDMFPKQIFSHSILEHHKPHWSAIWIKMDYYRPSTDILSLGSLSKSVYEAMGSQAEKTKFILIDRRNFRKVWTNSASNPNHNQNKSEKSSKSSFSEDPSTPKDDSSLDKDTFSKDSGFNLNTRRIQIDIRDLDLSGLDELKIMNDSGKRNTEYYPIVAFSKHLCGAATDLALKCLQNYQKSGGIVAGVVFALCCHHACKYSMYCNQKYLNHYLDEPNQTVNPQSEALSPEGRNANPNFGTNCKDESITSVINKSVHTYGDLASTRMDFNPTVRDKVVKISSTSSWAICGWEKSSLNSLDPFSENTSQTEKLSDMITAKTLNPEEVGVKELSDELGDLKDQRIMLGKYCKRFFDLGRLEYARESLGLKSSDLVIYTTPDVSPENLALVGIP